MGRHETVTVELYLKGVREKGASFWDREYEPGEKVTWVNLPLSQVEFDLTAPVNTVVSVQMPLWLAHNEGLI